MSRMFHCMRCSKLTPELIGGWLHCPECREELSKYCPDHRSQRIDKRKCLVCSEAGRLDRVKGFRGPWDDFFVPWNDGDDPINHRDLDWTPEEALQREDLEREEYAKQEDFASREWEHTVAGPEFDRVELIIDMIGQVCFRVFDYDSFDTATIISAPGFTTFGGWELQSEKGTVLERTRDIGRVMLLINRHGIERVEQLMRKTTNTGE